MIEITKKKKDINSRAAQKQWAHTLLQKITVVAYSPVPSLKCMLIGWSSPYVCHSGSCFEVTAASVMTLAARYLAAARSTELYNGLFWRRRPNLFKNSNPNQKRYSIEGEKSTHIYMQYETDIWE